MKLSYVSCALIAGVIAAALPAPMFAEKHFLPIQQQVKAFYQQGEITGSIGSLIAAGQVIADLEEIAKGLTCEQIRIMDEVELITDDSYCT